MHENEVFLQLLVYNNGDFVYLFFQKKQYNFSREVNL